MLFHCLITEIATKPVGPVTALEDITVVCLSSITDDVKYSWHRVNGSIPYKSQGRNSNTLIIPRATPYDEGVYYCKASKNGITVESNKVVVRVNGRLMHWSCTLALIKDVIHWTGLDYWQ